MDVVDSILIPLFIMKQHGIVHLGKLSYFTNLNLAAIWGWFPLFTMISSEGEQWGGYNLPRLITNWTVDSTGRISTTSWVPRHPSRSVRAYRGTWWKTSEPSSRTKVTALGPWSSLYFLGKVGNMSWKVWKSDPMLVRKLSELPLPPLKQTKELMLDNHWSYVVSG